MLWYTYLYENRMFTNKMRRSIIWKGNAWEAGWVRKVLALIKSLIYSRRVWIRSNKVGLNYQLTAELMLNALNFKVKCDFLTCRRKYFLLCSFCLFFRNIRTIFIFGILILVFLFIVLPIFFRWCATLQRHMVFLPWGKSVVPKLFRCTDHLELFGGPRNTKYWFQ